MMQAAYYESHPSPYSGNPNKKAEHPEEDIEQVAASFLLSLKHSRSVTPEPSLDDSEHTARRAAHQSYTASPNYGYEHPYPESRPQSAGEEPSSLPDSMTPPPQIAAALSNVDLAPYETLIDNSSLVLMKDRDLVPDSLFVAMAQMKACRLTHADRVGCYKNRELGFLGMCCKHCQGQPGFGRYYPNSVRSLAQTTTSQTILKHIGTKCRFCPPEVRTAVLQLQAQANACEGMSTGRPRYGSRKIFFQRVWARLHHCKEADDDDDNNDDDKVEDDLSSETPSDAEVESDDDASAGPQQKRKNRFGSLPLQKNKRIKTTVALV